MQFYINSNPAAWFITPFYSKVGLQISLDASSDNAISSAEKTRFEMFRTGPKFHKLSSLKLIVSYSNLETD